jgi:hypothetical protein
MFSSFVLPAGRSRVLRTCTALALISSLAGTVAAAPKGTSTEPVVWRQGAALALPIERFATTGVRQLEADEVWTARSDRVQRLHVAAGDYSIALPHVGMGGVNPGTRFLVHVDPARGATVRLRDAKRVAVEAGSVAFADGPQWLLLVASVDGWSASRSSGREIRGDSEVFEILGAETVRVSASGAIAPSHPRADGWAIRFRTDAPRFFVNALGEAHAFRIRVDGEIRGDVRTVGVDGTRAWFYVDLGGVAGGVDREIEILADSLVFDGLVLPDSAHRVLRTGETGPVATAVVVGDGSGLGATRSAHWAMGELLGLEIYNRPWAATGYMADDQGRGATLLERAPEDSISPDPDLLIVSAGGEEIGLGFSEGRYRAAVARLFDYYREVLPDVQKVALSPFGVGPVVDPEILQKSAIIREEAEARGYVFVDWTGWISGLRADPSTGNAYKYLEADGRTPNQPGLSYLGWRMAHELGRRLAAAESPAAVDDDRGNGLQNSDTGWMPLPTVAFDGPEILSAATDAASLSSEEIGSGGTGGSSSYDAGSHTHTVRGGGGDISGASDRFRFLHQGVSGNTELIVRVASLVQTNGWAKAGLMIRASTAANSAHVSVFVTPSNGVRLQWRPSAGASGGSTGAFAGAAPRYLRLVR